MSSKPLLKLESIAEENPHYLDPEEYPGWREHFGNDRPITLEIGFGNGNFLLDMAVRFPEYNYVGMDFYHKGIRRLFTRLQRLGLENIRVAYGDAKEKVPFLFQEGELAEIYINFPDPWPKKRHHKRRLIKPHTVACFREKLAPEGRLRLATDYEPYAMEMLEILNQDSGLRNLHPAPGFTNLREDIPRTKYEKNFLNQGKTIYYLDYVKVPTA